MTQGATRIAVIADIHGNLTALNAVLADLAGAGVDQVVCLGDVAAIGPQPHIDADLVVRAVVQSGMPHAEWLASGWR